MRLFLDSVWQDLLGIGIILAVVLFGYMRAKRKTFKEIMSDVKEAFG